jgi:predicted RNA-binding Zn-ribbon protein involved in translation (DUF1610 family)
MKCPNCGSDYLRQTESYSEYGNDAYICDSCGCYFEE